ncbi:MAG: hypothetical protein ACE5JZ_01590 [Kiloniellales bacterium]
MPYKLFFLDWLRWEFTARHGWDRGDDDDPVLVFARYVLFENERLGDALRNLDAREPQDIVHQLVRRKAGRDVVTAFGHTWRQFISFRSELDKGMARYRRHYELGTGGVQAA